MSPKSRAKTTALWLIALIGITPFLTPSYADVSPPLLRPGMPAAAAFQANLGQIDDPDIALVYSMRTLSVGFVTSGLRLIPANDTSSGPRTPPAVLRLSYLGAHQVAPQPRKRLPHPSHYLVGNNPSTWTTGVPSFEEIVYPDLYDGIDLVLRSTPRGIKSDFIVHPGADPRVIRIAYESTASLTIDNGALVVRSGHGELREDVPVAFQGDRTIGCAYVLIDEQTYGFALSDWDRSRPLIIDPLLYATFLGGAGNDRPYAIGVDDDGYAYVTGRTQATDFPTTSGALSETYGGGQGDVFVAKLNRNGTALEWATYLGGIGDDIGQGIDVDASGNVWVTGDTKSPNFPTAGPAFDTNLGGNSDMFVARLAADGASLVYSTYIGGGSDDEGNVIHVDQGVAYVGGHSFSNDFPIVPAGRTEGATLSGLYSGVVLILSSDGSSLEFSRYLGGSHFDEVFGLNVDSYGDLFVAGLTGSSDFPTTTGAYQETFGGNFDAFVTKLHRVAPPGGDPGDIEHSTYLGGTAIDQAAGMALGSDSVFVTGFTHGDFPTTGSAFQTIYGGAIDGFVAKLPPDLGSLAYSTYVGGSNSDRAEALDVSGGEAYVTGGTESTDGFADERTTTDEDVFFIRLNTAGTDTVSSDFLGGTFDDKGYGVRRTKDGTFLTGIAWSTTLATPGAFDETNNGLGDAFVARYGDCTLPDVTPPGFTCPDPVEFIVNALMCDVVFDPDPNLIPAIDDCAVRGNITLTPSIPLPATLTEGVHTITWTAEDEWGNTSTCDQIVTVICAPPIPPLPVTVGFMEVDGDSIWWIENPSGASQFRVSGHVTLGIAGDSYIPLDLGANSDVDIDLDVTTIDAIGTDDMTFRHEGIEFPIALAGTLSIDAKPQTARVEFDGRVSATEGIGDFGLEGHLLFDYKEKVLDVTGGAFANLSFLFNQSATFEATADLTDTCFRASMTVEASASLLEGNIQLPNATYGVTMDFTNKKFTISLNGSIFDVEGTGDAFGIGCPLPVCGGVGFRYDPLAAEPMIDLFILESMSIGLPGGTAPEPATVEEITPPRTIEIEPGEFVSVEDTEALEEPEEAEDTYVLPVSFGITILGEEPYTDVNCNAQYDLGEPFEDTVIEDGVWTAGSRFYSTPSAPLNLSAHATLDMTLAWAYNLRLASAMLELDWAGQYLELEVESGIELGSVNDPWFTLEFGPQAYFRLDWGEPTTIYGVAEFVTPFGVNLDGSFNAAFANGSFQELSGSFNADVELLGFFTYEVASADFTLRRSGIEFDASFDTPVFDASTSVTLNRDRFAGELTAGFSIGKYSLASASSSFKIDDSSLFISADAKWRCIKIGTLSLTWKEGWSKPKIKAKLRFALCSPLELHFYDELGRHVGRNPTTGEIEIEIPGAVYVEDGDAKYIEIPDGAISVAESRVVLEGYDSGTFDFLAEIPASTGTESHVLEYLGQPTSDGTMVELAISTATEAAGFPMDIDSDGDGNVDSIVPPTEHLQEEADSSIPELTGFDVSTVGTAGTDVLVTWTSSVPMISHVLYGADSTYTDTTAVDSTLKTQHAFAISGLTPGLIHRFRGSSTDTLGQTVLTREIVLAPVIADADLDGVHDGQDNCPNDPNPGQEDTDGIVFTEAFEDSSLARWGFSYSTLGFQEATNCVGGWSSKIDTNAISGAYSARLRAYAESACVDTYRTRAVIDAVVDSANHLFAKIRFNEIQGTGDAGLSRFLITVRDANDHSHHYTWGFATTATYGDQPVVVSPGQTYTFDEDIADPLVGKYGGEPPSQWLVQFWVEADRAWSGVRSADVHLDDIRFSFDGGTPDGVGDVCDNCPTLFNPGQGDENMNGIGDECDPATVDVPPRQPHAFALWPTVPNPFRQETTIRYDLPRPARVDLRIYDVSGRLVRRLEHGSILGPGRHEAVWRGRDENGRAVEAGIYFYELRSGDFRAVRRMVFMQ